MLHFCCLHALSGSSDVPGAICMTIADAQCDLLLSVSVSSLPTAHTVLVVIDDAFRLQLQGFLSHDSHCLAREGRLKLKIEDEGASCQSLQVGSRYKLCVQHVEDDCPRIVPGVLPVPLPRKRYGRQSSGGECNDKRRPQLCDKYVRHHGAPRSIVNAVFAINSLVVNLKYAHASRYELAMTLYNIQQLRAF